MEVLEGPIYVETMEAGQQAARKLAGRDALEEDFFPGNYFPIREELADGGCIYAIDYKDGWNIYKIQDVPLKENYTVVIHADLTAGDNALEARLFSLMDGVWRHQGQIAALLGVSLVAFALLAVYLCCAAGHKPGSQEIRPGLSRFTRFGKLTFRRFFPKPNTRGFACMEKDYGRLSVEWHSDSLHGCRFDVFRRFADRTFFCKSDSGATGLFRCSYV